MGGAIFTCSGTVSLLNTTLSANVASNGGRDLYAYSGAADHTINNTILAQSDTSETDLAGYSATFSGANNIVRSYGGSGCTFSLTGTLTGDPLLGALASNGGPTQSLLPQSTSPAANAGSDAAAGGLSDDQRGSGYPRVSGPHVDVGALEFFGVPSYTLTYNAGANGSIGGTTPQTVSQGADGAAVTPVPGTGYHFVQWSDASTANPRTDTNVQGDITVTARLRDQHLHPDVQCRAHGSITGPSPQTVNHGADCTAVTAQPAAHYHFVNWTGTADFTSTDNPLTLTNVTTADTITATFAIDAHTIIFAADENGSFTGHSPQTVDYGNDCAAVTAVPEAGYHFVRWTGTGSFTSTANPLTLTGVTDDDTVTAHFAIIDYTVTFIASQGGSIGGQASQSVEYGGNSVAVTAVPASGYRFINWTAAAGFRSTDNPLTVTNITAADTITALFAQNPDIHVTVQSASDAVDPAGGTVSVGQELPVDVNIANTGGDATDVRVIMPLPENTEFVSGSVVTDSNAKAASGEVTIENGNIVIQVPQLPAGATISVRLVLRAVQSGTIVLTPSVQTAEQPYLAPAGQPAEVTAEDVYTKQTVWQPSRICGKMGWTPVVMTLLGLASLKLVGRRVTPYRYGRAIQAASGPHAGKRRRRTMRSIGQSLVMMVLLVSLLMGSAGCRCQDLWTLTGAGLFAVEGGSLGSLQTACFRNGVPIDCGQVPAGALFGSRCPAARRSCGTDLHVAGGRIPTTDSGVTVYRPAGRLS